MTETLPQYLERREAELVAAIKAREDEIAPMRSELADVRRARDALKPVIIAVPPQGAPADQQSASLADLTIKDLTLKALRECFPTRGATALELLRAFDVMYDRTITRTSLSPQLSRLKEEGKIRRDNKHWFLVTTNYDTLIERMERDDATV